MTLLRRYTLASAFVAFLFASTSPCLAKSPPQALPVLMLSDIHLDPFHDPAKFARLRKAGVNDWQEILDEPYSPAQAADFNKLQTACGARGVDTPIELLESSLAAMHQQQPAPLFITVSGDLMAHGFDCRFHALAPNASPAEYSDFAAKTVRFVAQMLFKTYANTPIYLALGNNDSGCTDYREDPNSSFLKNAAGSFAADTKTPANRYDILSKFSQYGDYSLALPLKNTRLIVLQDIFESKRYATCGGANTIDLAKDQITWLRNQLASARKSHEHVWVMAHIPPGIDAYSTFSKSRNICGGQAPETFLSSDDLGNTIADFGDVIRLALFAHTHMDEFRVYPSANAPGGFVPGKLVPSISPVNGNNPAFTIAQIDPATATLKDYNVYAANNAVGIGTTWALEYRFSTTYGLPDLSGASLAKLTSSFVADKNGTAKDSTAYQNFFFVGDAATNALSKGGAKAQAMQSVWTGYSCAITQTHAADFRSCLCAAQQ